LRKCDRLRQIFFRTKTETRKIWGAIFRNLNKVKNKCSFYKNRKHTFRHLSFLLWMSDWEGNKSYTGSSKAKHVIYNVKTTEWFY
jgi:hypothetical protein